MIDTVLRLRRFVSANRIILFFVLFIVSLGIEDGPQSGSDIYWPLATLLTVPFWELTPLIQFSKPTDTALWTLMIISVILSTVFSWNPGYSITSVMRLLVGIIWIQRFMNLTYTQRQKLPELFAYTILCIMFISMTLLSIPMARHSIPAFTLISSASGHFPFVYITLPLLALVLLSARNMRPRLSHYAIGAGVLSVFMSFSRIALITGGVMCIVASTKKPGLSNRITMTVIGMLMLFCAILFIGTSALYPQRLQQLPKVLHSYIVKNDMSSEPRLAFIREGVTAFQTSPLLGTGPGTFALVSQRFADSQNNVSLYTHNVWLMIATETGIAGSITACLLIFWYASRLFFKKSARVQKDRNNTDIAPYVAALLILLVFGTIQSSFDHYPVWILTAIILGVLITPPASKKTGRFSRLSCILLVSIGAYTASWIASDIATITGRTNTAYLIAPYREAKALNLLAYDTLTTQKSLPLIQALFPESYRITIARTRNETNFNTWNTLMEQAIAQYPSNMSIQLSYLSALSKTSPVTICRAISKLTKSTEFPCMDRTVLSFLESPALQGLLPLWNGPWGPSKFLYAVGLSILQENADPLLVITLWSRARDLAPQWAYFHVELANLIAHYTNDPKAAIPTLLSCLANPYAKEQCQRYLRDLSTFSEPGSEKNAILAIPEHLDQL